MNQYTISFENTLKFSLNNLGVLCDNLILGALFT